MAAAEHQPQIPTPSLTIHWEDQPVAWWQVDYIGPLLHGTGDTVTSLELTLTLIMGLPFVQVMLCLKISWGLAEYLSHSRVRLHSIASDQGTHFMDREVRQWVRAPHPLVSPSSLKHLTGWNNGVDFVRHRYISN